MRPVAKKSRKPMDTDQLTKAGQKGPELIQGKKHADNPWIQEMTLRDSDPIKALTKRGSVTGDLKNLSESKDAEMLAAEFNLEMFMIPNQRECRQITRYDTWEHDLPPEEWLAKCKSSPEESHGLSPVYNGETYIWQPVKVEDYDYASQKYQVIVLASGQRKLVTRLALQFNFEDSEQFCLRLKECRERRDMVETELRFQDFVDVVDTEAVTLIPSDMVKEIEKKVQIRADNFDPQHSRATTDRLLQVVDIIYKRTMKKCVVLQDMLHMGTIAKLQDIRIPVKFTQTTVPYSAVIDVGRGGKKPQLSMSKESDSYFAGRSQEFMRVKSMAKIEDMRCTGRLQDKLNPHAKKLAMSKWKKPDKKRLTRRAEELLSWQTGNSPVGKLTDSFQTLCEQYKRKKLFQTDLTRLQLPMRSSEFMKQQDKKIKATMTDILNNWRFQILHDIREKIKGSIKFDESNLSQYEKSDAKTLIRKFDLIFHKHLGEFFHQSIEDLIQFFQMFTVPKDKDLWKLSEKPLIEIDLRCDTGKKDDENGKEKIKGEKTKKHKRDDKHKKSAKDEGPKEIFFAPTLDECRAKILSLLTKMVESAEKITILETEDYNVFLSGRKQPAFNISNETSEIKNAYSKLNQMIDECIVGPLDLLAKFKKYEFLMAGSMQEITNAMKKEKPPTLEELKEKLEEYTKAEYEVKTLAIDKVQFTMFQVDTTSVKYNLANRARKMKKAWLKAINNYCIHTIEDINTKYVDLQTKMEDKPTSKQAYKELKSCLRESDKRVEELKSRHEMVRMHIGLLEDHLIKFDKAGYNSFFKIYCYPSNLRTKKAKGNNNLINYEEQIRIELEHQKETFDQELIKYNLAYNEIIRFNDIESAKNVYPQAFKLNEDIEKAIQKAIKINEDEDLLEMKRTEYSVLDKLEKDFKPFYTLTCNSEEIQRLISEWTVHAFITLKPAEVVEYIENWMTGLETLNKQLEDFKDQADVALQLKSVVTDFTQHLDLIKYLRSEAMREEEWIEISKVTPLDLKYNDEALTLSGLIKKGAENYMEEIKEIWDRAERKLELEKNLKKMKEEMNKKKLEVTRYEEAGTYLISNYEFILEAIDEQIGTTQAMLSSPYMTGILRRNCTIWATRLTNLSEILEELKKCQKTWIYLQPMFAAEDIRLTLKREAEQFADVDSKWRQQMETMNSENLVVSLLDKERIKEEFIRANQDLDAVLRSMADFLEAKRKKFPRFYFVSDEDLLKIISNAKKDPTTLEPYLNKCFEAINGFEITTPNQEIVSVSSVENEKIALIRPLGVKEGDRKGNAEIWLKDLEKVVFETLKDLCKRAIKDYAANPRAKWITSWPGQIVLLVNQIMWTSSVEAALHDSRIKTMEQYEDKLKAQINEAVTLVRGNLDYIQRLTLETLLILDVHSKEIVRNLIEKKILDDTAFEWISQMRYNYEKDDVKVKMLTATLNYGFEYIGNSSRLVITPLTDRCYQTLMTAKQMSQGGAPEGSAGSGKTETVKDLAKALGVYCVIFNGSEDLDHIAIAKFFKGIASAGAWCCFDEFNRIDLEVLSVIASQILMIQQALTMEQTVFHFIDEDVALNPQCGINITMNPGGIGRTPLPDNLKALFRPCAMTVPDYALITEILLYSYGFHEAKALSRKVVTLLKLCGEQLAAQEHYDFGMRALHSILTTAQGLRRKLPEQKEDVIIRKALDDINLPKLTEVDAPLYEGIAADLFPDVELKTESSDTIKKSIEEALVGEKLQITDRYVNKCVQIYETTLARHGVIIIGEAFSGKTQAISVLKKALTTLKEYEGYKYANMLVRTLNPKAIDFKQLYGSFDGNSRVWTDGVLPTIVRECTELETLDANWVVFDGPVDSAWMESMNTVLDDNKKLCLSSGSVIKLKPNLTMLFEVEELKHASPAIISRCGMVFMESCCLGWEVLVKSYVEGLPQILTAKRIKAVEDHMLSVLRPAVAFMAKHCKFQVDIKSMHLVRSFLNLFESFVGECRLPTYKLPNDMDTAIPNIIVFCLIWSLGGCIEQVYKEKFNEFVQDMMNAKDVKMKYKLELASNYTSPRFIVKFKEGSNVFEMGYDRKKNGWKNWTDSVENAFAEYTKDTKFHEIIVPTMDSIRAGFLSHQLLKSGKHILFVGPTGTGKTINIINELKKSFSSTQYTYMTLCMSAKTSANQAQRTIEGKLEKRGRKVQYGPLLGKKGVVFIDDLNMPEKDQFESQPPLELLRQWMDYGGWYDIDSQDRRFKLIEDICFVGAMAPPSSGRQTITTRFLRHYNVIYTEHQEGKALKSMFKNILNWKLSNSEPQYLEQIMQLTTKLTEATVETYLSVIKEPELRPTPSKSHYTFNLRDMAKVFEGLCRSSPHAIKKEEDMIKLWAHESIRVFHDRLVSTKDREVFMKLLKGHMKEHFEKEWDSLVSSEPLIFSNFVPCVYPDGDTTKEPISGIYAEVADMALLKSTMESYLNKYNAETQKGKLEIVLFMSAIEHIAQILRVITLPHGHVLLVGVGGSGRRSLTSLATFIGKFHLYKVEPSRKYRVAEWRADLRNLMSMTGVDRTPTVFFLSDAQINNDAFLEDMNSILNTGEVPNLYSKLEKNDNKDDLISKLRENILLHHKKTCTLDEEVLETLKEHSKENLHIVFTMSPMSEQFRHNLRKFPSIVNCTTANWFLPWPEEALRSVAQQYLGGAELGEKEQEGIVNICVDMQERARSLTERYKKEMQFHYYVTPTSYLELLKIFKNLLTEKRKNLLTGIKQYETGLAEMSRTESFVTQMRAKLMEMEPEQKKRNENAIHLAESLRKKHAEVQEETKIVQQEEEKAKEAKKIADELQAECQANYDKALPELKDAEKAIKAIDPGTILTLQRLPSPSDALKPVAKALCILLDIKPKVVPKSEPDYWLPKKIFTQKNLKKLTEYDKENISLAKITELKKVTETPEFTTEKIVSVSEEGEAIARWIRALIKFDQVNREIAPKKAQLKEESEKSKAAEEAWAKTSKQLEEKKALLVSLKQQSENAEAQKKKLTQEIDSTKKKIERARDLLDLLKNENKRWKEQWKDLQERYNNILGDVLVSSGIIAYLGVFPANYRESCTESWRELLAKFDIPKSSNFSLFNALCDPVEKLIWQKQKLPTDAISTDNAIIMDKSTRWPLFIDPQRQAVNWIKNKERVEVVKNSQKIEYILKRLSANMSAGTTILFEEMDETIDPRLIPLIKKETSMEAGKTVIKLGEENVLLHKNFKFYMATKMSRPHYSPEICAQVTMLNFMATEESLTDQMLNIIVRKEDPTIEKKREDSIQNSVETKKRLKGKEEEILNIVTSRKEEILESDQPLETLRITKSECQKSTSQVEEQRKASEKIEQARSKFQSVAKRVASLYLCVSDLAKVDPMYQYSLEWYQELYKKALQIDPDVDPVAKLDLYKKKFIYLLFTSVSKSLFEKDKLLFTLSLLLNIFVTDEVNTPAEVKFLASGPTSISAECPANPVPKENTWLSDKAWQTICELSRSFPAFKDLDSEISKNLAAWEKVCTSADFVNPTRQPWPNDWSQPEKLNALQRLILINGIRPEKFIEAVHVVIAENLGKEFLEYPPLNLEEAYASASHKVPILFILSPGADPLAELKVFAEKKGLVNGLVPLSLGKGQGKKADFAIDHALKSSQGGWVIMQNCHFATSYLSRLEKKLDEIPDEPKLPFRLWLTSMPTQKFPVTLLQNAVKITNEQPKGIARKMLDTYSKLNSSKFSDSNPKPQTWRKLLYSLSIFHAIVQERSKYGSLGWNATYDFSHSDFLVSMEHLHFFLKEYPTIPWDAVQYMIADINYGGRISDPFDSRCMKATLSELFNTDALKDGYRFCKRKEYALPADLKTKENYMNYLKGMPIIDNLEVFGLNETASITCSLNDSKQILGMLLTMLSHNESGSAGSKEEEVAAKVKTLLEETPNEFDLEECNKKFPYMPTQCLNTVLLQELNKYNMLLSVVRKSLNELQAAIKGYGTMSHEIEDIADSLLSNSVPKLWEAHAYPSLKPLSSWVKDLIERVKFFQDWVDKGSVSSYWIPAFFFAQSFFTAILQNHSRATKIPIDSLVLDHTILSELDGPRETGCTIHGLFIEGAKWGAEKRQLEEAEAKVPYYSMPPIWLQPVEKLNLSPNRHVYECPVYKTTKRQGVVSANGYMMTVALPMSNDHTAKHWIKRGVAMLSQLNYQSLHFIPIFIHCAFYINIVCRTLVKRMTTNQRKQQQQQVQQQEPMNDQIRIRIRWKRLYNILKDTDRRSSYRVICLNLNICQQHYRETFIPLAFLAQSSITLPYPWKISTYLYSIVNLAILCRLQQKAICIRINQGVKQQKVQQLIYQEYAPKMKVELLEICWHGDNTRISSIDFFPNSSYLVSSGVDDEEKLYIHVFPFYFLTIVYSTGKSQTEVSL
eukprot:TRINITY_DN70784_c2_g1_i1.p1 TRINITY_DN70784_c2_g1~~TRINITY_DN70784_c2_g1_i1.p1  ORF type:complete len:4393 (-),score=612.94 TRINITY_DN70784_c2_g1_i1:3426-16604(-)